MYIHVYIHNSKVTRPINAPPAANAELSLTGASAEDGNEEVEEVVLCVT